MDGPDAALALTLASFLGEWSLARTIRHRSGQEARLDGRATFGREGEALLYREAGTLTLPGGQALHAERRYVWRSAPGGAMVHFEDGRPFHRVDLGSPRPEATHLCAPDVYEVAYDLSAFPDWSCAWRVRGPRKDYRIVSRYARPR